MKKTVLTAVFAVSLLTGSLSAAHAILPAGTGSEKEEKEQLALNNEFLNDITEPTLVVRGNRVFLLGETDEASDLQVDIYYKGGEHVFGEEIASDGGLMRVYNFSAAQSGWYLFKIKYEDQRIREYLHIN